MKNSFIPLKLGVRSKKNQPHSIYLVDVIIDTENILVRDELCSSNLEKSNEYPGTMCSEGNQVRRS